MKAQMVFPEWPTASYLQAAALFSLGMDSDAQECLNDGTNLEANRNKTWIFIEFIPFSSVSSDLFALPSLYLYSISSFFLLTF